MKAKFNVASLSILLE